MSLLIGRSVCRPMYSPHALLLPHRYLRLVNDEASMMVQVADRAAAAAAAPSASADSSLVPDPGFEEAPRLVRQLSAPRRMTLLLHKARTTTHGTG